MRDSQVAETMTRVIARARARARVARHRDGHGLPRRTHGRRRLAVGGGSDRALRAVRAEQVSASADKRSLTFGARHRQPLLRRVADTLPTFSRGLPTGLPKRSPTRRWCYGRLANPCRPTPTAGVWLCLLLRMHRADGVSRPLQYLLTEPADRSAFAVLARRVDAAARPRAGGDGRGRPCRLPQAAGLDRSESPVVGSWRVAHPTEARQVGGISPTTEPILLTRQAPC